jgi:putative transposase
MARISRIVVPGYPHHVTQRGVRSMDVFNSDEDRQAYLLFLSEEANRFGLNILAWCLMTNHVHFIVVPYKETSLARGFGEAHRRYTRMKNFAQGVRGYLFQGRFNSSVLDENHLLAAVRYVELNPVQAGMVKYAWEYPWSSAGFHIGKSASDPLVMDKTLFGLISDWKGFLVEGMGSGESDRLRMATQTGLPAGDDAFVAKIAGLAGRDLSKGKPGRPRKQ